MKFLNKAVIVAGAISLSLSILSATTYIVESGDTLGGIANKLGYNSIKAAGITSVPSGNMNLIFVGDEIHYISKHKKKRIILRKNKVDLDKFCFEDNRSIHYKADERCKLKKAKIHKRKAKKKTSSHSSH